MIDEGAVFKLRRARIGVGSSAPGIDRSGGALQVLGTPNNKVYFTSYHDETIGTDSFSFATTPLSGDWGGLRIYNLPQRSGVREQQTVILDPFRWESRFANRFDEPAMRRH